MFDAGREYKRKNTEGAVRGGREYLWGFTRWLSGDVFFQLNSQGFSKEISIHTINGNETFFCLLLF